MKRNILRLLLSAAFVMCCTFSALAQLGTPPDNEIWYTTDNGKKLTAGKYEVGKPLCGKIIREHGEKNGHYYIKFDPNIEYIGESDFNSEDHITEVSLPNTITSIRDKAFNDCDGLVTFHMPNSVINLGYCAFYHCDKLKNLTLGSGLRYIGSYGEMYGVFEECDALEAVAIPASVTLLGRNAFYDCNSLKFVAIGSGVPSITEQAFYHCAELKSVVIDNEAGLTIGEKAFKNCKKLESVSFLGNTPPTSFGSDCFYNCPVKYHVLEEDYGKYNSNSYLSGKVVAGPPNNEIWYSTNNGGTAEHSYMESCRPKLNTYMVSHGVQFFDDNAPALGIGSNTFEHCSNLVSVVLPSSITYIGNSAFNECSSLVSVSIPSTVNIIASHAFAYCRSLKDIKLPARVTYIGDWAFLDCYSLQSITIPSGVHSIPRFVFDNCHSLRSMTILGTIENIGQYGIYCSNLYEIFYLGNGTPAFEDDHFSCPATIYVKDVAGHGNWGNRPVRSWRSGRGDGSAASPLEIGNYLQLYGFSLEVEYMNGANLCAKLTSDITGNASVLNEDGSLKTGSFKQWLPIGSWDNNYNSSYKGEFDGGGHTVSGLYFNDGTKAPVGLFGMANGAYIHDVGVKDSYFRGKSHVAGICGDLASGRMENCWNAATVQSVNGTSGGIVGSCWHSAYMSSCHNIGKVAEGAFCGGVCGSVAKNTNVPYSVSNCFSLEGKCNVPYYPYEFGVGINNVSIKSASAFASGEVCYMLNGSQTSDSNKWRQYLGIEGYPTLSGEYLVYYNETSHSYYNYDGDISGWGTEVHPYRIGNKFELQMFVNIVNNTPQTKVCGILTADIIVNKNVLDGDGNLNSGMFEPWIPIGTSEKPFDGIFDGNGHTISGLYVDDPTMNHAALFGKVCHPAYIHDVGVNDSYFRGNIWVAGICGDLASGKIENCWNGATVIGCHVSTSSAGGIAGSCWKNASVNGCYNIGKISVEPGSSNNQCGGICGIVARNDNVTYSVSNCVSLEGKCEKAYNLYTETSDYTGLSPETYETIGNASVSNVHIKNTTVFPSGEACWILNGNKYGGRWRQQLGTDAYPTTSGTYFVNYTDERQYYNNEPTQEIWYTSSNGEIVTPNNFNAFGAGVTYNLYEGGQGIITFDKAVTSIGNYAFTLSSNYNLKSIEIPSSVTSIGNSAFEHSPVLQSVIIPNSVTSIGQRTFQDCRSLLSINIPSSVTGIGQYAFSDCYSLTTVTFNSLPIVSTDAFCLHDNFYNRILDLTDSEKPYIGTSLENYPDFTEAHYRGTLEPGEWGTITLPFVPSSHPGIVFFSIDNVDAANGTLTLSITENIEAGKPYLFRNQTGNAGFTLTATPAAPATDVPVTITASEQTVGSFALKGTFQAKELTEDGLFEQQDGEFVKVGSLNIDPFHAYLKDNGSSALTRIVIDGGTLVKITNQDDSTITLSGLKKVEFIKENGTPAVRVTRADNSNETYLNPKKVDFGK